MAPQQVEKEKQSNREPVSPMAHRNVVWVKGKHTELLEPESSGGNMEKRGQDVSWKLSV